MTAKTTFSKKLISVVICLALLFSYIPMTMTASADEVSYNRVVDANTMNLWENYFDVDNPDTTNAGGVWTDKSVFTDTTAFTGTGISMINDDENFLTALSALAANKEVVGYSTTPTDTVLVLDLSGSMRNSNSQDELVLAANRAIEQLLKVNNNNRVGVVLYSAESDLGSSTYGNSVTRILPLNRWETNDTDTVRINGEDITYNVYLNYSNNSVSIKNNTIRIEGQSNYYNTDTSKSFDGGTYIQAGLWEAMKMFTEVEDTKIAANNWQTGKQRMPIMVLMSDGAPSTGTSHYDDVGNSKYGNNDISGSNVGNGNENNLTAGNAFLTQLTAAYAMNRIENHYKADDGTIKGLFYTLGFNIGNNNVAKSVMDPDNSTFTDSLWSTYNGLTSGTMSVRVKSRNNQTSYTDVSISKNSYATSKSYVDEYFSASGDGLITAFDEIVEEIILQSRYYPTHLEGGSPDFSGYVTFEDQLGEYMEVKDVKGILLGTTLFDGHMMASKLTDTSEGGLGTVENPTDLGDEFIRAVKTRLGIAETVDAQILVGKAWDAKQLYYTDENNWSNYIGWYAKADGTYAGFWDENSTDPAPADAVYKMKSYGFLGETSGSIKNSDMMYMSVQIRTDIATGRQSVLWKIPASLVPMVTYLVTLKGTNIDLATDVSVTVEDKDTISPIRLVFETALRSDLNKYNITRITGQPHLDTDGHTRLFWNNYFDIDPNVSHDQHVTTKSEFTPSKENERFYYTFDSVLYKKVGENYIPLQNGEIDTVEKVYHRRHIFKKGETTPQFIYEEISGATRDIARNNWKASHEVMDGNQVVQTGAYIVPQGTVARELTPYDKQKDVNITNSAKMVFHPYITTQNEISYVDMNLGNNGLLKVTPAQGIKISKTVDVFEDGTNDTFKFRITANGLSGTYEGYITSLDATPEGTATAVTFTNGIFEVEIGKDQTFWLTGLPTGTTYTVEEISDNADYKVKSVHVNGTSTGTTANGTVAAYYIDDIDFVNTAVGEGDLVITKQVIDTSGNTVDIPDSIKFTAEVTLTDAKNSAVSGTFSANNTAGYVTVNSNGKFTVTLSEGESLILHDIPEETKYSVVETNVPNGFIFSEKESSMSGVVDASANDQALIVNTYAPTATNGNNVNVVINKEISGNRTAWNNDESYSFVVERLDLTRATSSVVENVTIDYNDADKSYSLTLANQNFTTEGSYYYRITETVGSNGGITYDTTERRFRVDVADSDKDGDLEVVGVVNQVNTTVTGTYTVTANFNNVYTPVESANVRIPIQKAMEDENGQPSSYALNGFQFALYDSSDIANADEIVRSTVTDSQGNAYFDLTYAPNRASIAGETYTYYMAEIDTGNPNIDYTNAVYEVKVTVTDNGDGTTTATPVITPLNEQTAVTTPVFTNTYIPSDEAYVTISGTKTVKGNRALNTNEFEFVLTAVTSGAPMPAEATVKNAADGSFVFGNIEFDETAVAAGTSETYYYTLTESQANKIGGFTYDDAVYNVAITVTNQNAIITANTVITKGTATVNNITFENEYTPTPIDVTLTADKILTGKTLQNGEFTFELTPVTDGAPMPTSAVNNVATAQNDEYGDISFDKINYTRAGTYVYTVTEQDKGDSRYDCDKSVYTVTVTVHDNSEGVLTHTISYTKNNMPSTEIVFRNGFVPEAIEYDITAKFGGVKTLTNNVGREIKADEFEFILINALSGQQIGSSVKNDANGNFVFDPIILPDVGNYHFKINEVIGSEKGVTYDTSSYHVVLTVKQNDSGELYIETDSDKLYKGTVVKEEIGGILTEVTHYEPADQIVFDNSYKAEPVSIEIGGEKTLEGKTLKADEFTFNLYSAGEAEDSGIYSKNEIIDSAKNDENGKFTFGAIEITDPGEYHYFVTELADGQKGVTYDTAEYEVIVTATDNLDGTMSVAYAYKTDKGDAEIIVFSNAYKAEPASIEIKGNKVLNGRTLKADEFTFNLYSAGEAEDSGIYSKNEIIGSAKNDANGNFTFSAIEITDAGEYHYFVTEVAGNEEGMTYDATEYEVIATVTDNLDGTMSVEYVYKTIKGNSEALTFINTYTEPPAEPQNPSSGSTEPIPQPQEPPAEPVEPAPAPAPQEPPVEPVEPTPQPQNPPTEPEVPTAPKTSDEQNLWMWIALAFVSATGFLATTVRKKRTNK